jgi:hypothetical protein
MKSELLIIMVLLPLELKLKHTPLKNKVTHVLTYKSRHEDV